MDEWYSVRADDDDDDDSEDDDDDDDDSDDSGVIRKLARLPLRVRRRYLWLRSRLARLLTRFNIFKKKWGLNSEESDSSDSSDSDDSDDNPRNPLSNLLPNRNNKLLPNLNNNKGK